MISVIYTGLPFFLEGSFKDITFMVFATYDNLIVTSSLPVNTNLQDQQKSDQIVDTSSIMGQQVEERDTCPLKPTSLEWEPRTSESSEPNAESAPTIRIKVPTLANTGSTLLVEGTGYIPLEQVRVELSVDWISSSPALKDKTFFQCKIIVANSLGSFTTTLKLPEMPFDTKGTGKYSIIGMESRQEKTKSSSFLTSDIGFSFRQ